jgi:hypothetical protein
MGYQQHSSPITAVPEDLNPFASNSIMNVNGSETNLWYYKDPSGNIRGPFSSLDMYAWYKDGYFHDDLEIACGENSMFFPLRDFKTQALK